MVIDKFSEIDPGDPNEYIKELDYSSLPEAYGKQETKKFYSFLPKKDYRSLKLIFPFPSQILTYKKKSNHYLSHLLGHEGPGSIYQHLASKGWITSLGAGESSSSSLFFLFSIDLDLSPEGEQHIDKIMEIIFNYINIVKNDIQEWIYDEVSSND